MTAGSAAVGRDVIVSPAGTVALQFRTRLDGSVFRIVGSAGSLELAVEGERLVYRVDHPARTAVIDAEDTASLLDGEWHSVAVLVDESGTRLCLDGYPVFTGTVDTFTAALGDRPVLEVGGAPVETREVMCTSEVWDLMTVLGAGVAPVPVAQFAANRLSAYDVRTLAELTAGTIEVKFRVRGRGQGGILLAAAGNGGEGMRITVASDAVTYAVVGRRGEWRTYDARGEWADGDWHDLVVRVAGGSVDLYLDGYRQAHLPGAGFFADVPGLDEVVVGQDSAGDRFWGEASRAAVYSQPLNDQQIKRRSMVPPLETTALFDRGYAGAASYRIPSLVVSPGGVVIAGADQRTSSPNDSPNHINFTIRRSTDEGRTWEGLQTVISSYGEGADGASVIDSCPVVDHEVGRVVVVIDHFRGGIGQPNNGPGTGVTAEGELELVGDDGNLYVWAHDGGVVDADGRVTGVVVQADGTALQDGAEIGNVYAATSPLRTVDTCFLLVTSTDDDGVTWAEPRHINHQVKEPWMRFCGTSPGTGVQLRFGPRKGRLVIPIYYEGDHLKRVSTAVIYSDDHGDTWHRGASANDGRVMPDGEVVESRTHDRGDASLHESTVVERSDGSLLMLMRNQHPSGRVLATRSHDGGESWGEVTVVDELTEIFCQPNAITLDADPDTVVFANASQMMPYRGNGVIRCSTDGGETWPWSRSVNPGHHVYQSMAELPGGDIGLLWENEWQGLYFTRLPREWFAQT